MGKRQSNVVKRKSILPLIISIILVSLLLIVSITYLSVKKIHSYLITSPTISALENSWKSYDYFTVHKLSHKIIQEEPFNNQALIYHGYSAFYLSVSQLDTLETKEFLDEAIGSLRIALYNSPPNITSQLYYMLGKAYFYKNTVTSYYYADLALRYLLLAKEEKYQALDMAEYIGLSYAALGEHIKSIASFTEALLTRESPSLLLSIAEEYYKTGQANISKQYLYRIKKECEDDTLIVKSMNMLGSIYIEEKDYLAAEAEFTRVLEINTKDIDALYGLGVVYEKKGDLIKARSQWRSALKIRGNYAPALEKLSSYR